MLGTKADFEKTRLAAIETIKKNPKNYDPNYLDFLESDQYKDIILTMDDSQTLFNRVKSRMVGEKLVKPFSIYGYTNNNKRISSIATNSKSPLESLKDRTKIKNSTMCENFHWVAQKYVDGDGICGAITITCKDCMGCLHKRKEEIEDKIRMKIHVHGVDTDKLYKYRIMLKNIGNNKHELDAARLTKMIRYQLKIQGEDSDLLMYVYSEYRDSIVFLMEGCFDIDDMDIDHLKYDHSIVKVREIRAVKTFSLHDITKTSTYRFLGKFRGKGLVEGKETKKATNEMIETVDQAVIDRREEMRIKYGDDDCKNCNMPMNDHVRYKVTRKQFPYVDVVPKFEQEHNDMVNLHYPELSWKPTKL